MIRSKIVHIDTAGNASLEIKRKDLALQNINLGDAVYLRVDTALVKDLPCLSGHYCASLKPVLLSKPNGIVISVRHGDARQSFGLKEGQEVTIGLSQPQKYWEQENAYSFSEIKKRLNTMSLEAFANFRPLFKNSDQFYRSSSPFDNAYGRAKSVVQCVNKYQIRTIIDVADSAADFHQNLLTAHIKSKKLLCGCKIYPVGDDSGLFSAQFQNTVRRALELIVDNRGPFLIHCRAGKRRSGFICAILQGLAGMSADAIMDDYMISYRNNNGVTFENNRGRYEYLKADTIGKILTHINGPNLSGDLRYSTSIYLRSIGLSEWLIEKLAAKIVCRKKSP